MSVKVQPNDFFFLIIGCIPFTVHNILVKIQSISLIMINLFHFYDFQQVILTRLSDLNLLEYFQIVYV